MSEIHRLAAQVAVVLAVLGTAWTGVVVARGETGGRFWAANLVWTTVAIAVAGILGVLLLAGGPDLADALHLLYGALAVAALPGAAIVAAGRPARQRSAVLLGGGVVLLAVLARLFQTG